MQALTEQISSLTSVRQQPAVHFKVGKTYRLLSLWKVIHNFVLNREKEVCVSAHLWFAFGEGKHYLGNQNQSQVLSLLCYYSTVDLNIKWKISLIMYNCLIITQIPNPNTYSEIRDYCCHSSSGVSG